MLSTVTTGWSPDSYLKWKTDNNTGKRLSLSRKNYKVVLMISQLCFSEKFPTAKLKTKLGINIRSQVTNHPSLLRTMKVSALKFLSSQRDNYLNRNSNE